MFVEIALARNRESRRDALGAPRRLAPSVPLNRYAPDITVLPTIRVGEATPNHPKGRQVGGECTSLRKSSYCLHAPARGHLFQAIRKLREKFRDDGVTVVSSSFGSVNRKLGKIQRAINTKIARHLENVRRLAAEDKRLAELQKERERSLEQKAQPQFTALPQGPPAQKSPEASVISIKKRVRPTAQKTKTPISPDYSQANSGEYDEIQRVKHQVRGTDIKPVFVPRSQRAPPPGPEVIRSGPAIVPPQIRTIRGKPHLCDWNHVSQAWIPRKGNF